MVGKKRFDSDVLLTVRSNRNRYKLYRERYMYSSLARGDDVLQSCLSLSQHSKISLQVIDT